MNKALSILGMAGFSVLLAGCISHSSTVYTPVSRARVEFENEKAGRVFYEKLSTMPPCKNRESHTEFSIPILFSHERTVKVDDNERFNQAVSRCDTNQDGKITEAEAQIFAAQRSF